jgi:hypothetical protein
MEKVKTELMGCFLYLFFGLTTLAFCFMIVFMTELARKESNQMRKACELAEISPDFSPQEKAQCRILRKEVK